MVEWRDIASAPYSTPVRVKVGGMTFLARLEPDASMSDMDTSCDQWQAVNEGEHPPCWSEGACWESNLDGDCSMQPEAWTPTPDGTGSGEAFQRRVQPWMMECFGEQISGDMLERADRFTEEALELVQTMPGFTAARAHALVDYVFGRDVGERYQEVGGVMVTLAALCLAAGENMHDAGEIELARINQPHIVQKIRAKQAAKPTGSALPVATPKRDEEQAGEDTKLSALIAALTDDEVHVIEDLRCLAEHAGRGSRIQNTCREAANMIEARALAAAHKEQS